jgi:hypothetical protein
MIFYDDGFYDSVDSKVSVFASKDVVSAWASVWVYEYEVLAKASQAYDNVSSAAEAMDDDNDNGNHGMSCYIQVSYRKLMCRKNCTISILAKIIIIFFS